MPESFTVNDFFNTYTEVLQELLNNLKSNNETIKDERYALEKNRLLAKDYESEVLNEEGINDYQDNLFIKLRKIFFPDQEEDDDDPLTDIRVRVYSNGKVVFTSKKFDDQYECNEMIHINVKTSKKPVTFELYTEKTKIGESYLYLSHVTKPTEYESNLEFKDAEGYMFARLNCELKFIPSYQKYYSSMVSACEKNIIKLLALNEKIVEIMEVLNEPFDFYDKKQLDAETETRREKERKEQEDAKAKQKQQGKKTSATAVTNAKVVKSSTKQAAFVKKDSTQEIKEVKDAVKEIKEWAKEVREAKKIGIVDKEKEIEKDKVKNKDKEEEKAKKLDSKREKNKSSNSIKIPETKKQQGGKDDLKPFGEVADGTNRLNEEDDDDEKPKPIELNFKTNLPKGSSKRVNTVTPIKTSSSNLKRLNTEVQLKSTKHESQNTLPSATRQTLSPKQRSSSKNLTVKGDDVSPFLQKLQNTKPKPEQSNVENKLHKGVKKEEVNLNLEDATKDKNNVLPTITSEPATDNMREIVHQLKLKNMTYRHDLMVQKQKLEQYEKAILQKESTQEELLRDRIHEFIEEERVNLEGANVQDSDILSLTTAVGDFIKEINLSQNLIGANGLKELISIKWYNLEILDLSYNGFGKEGIEILGLQTWSSLNSLLLGGNRIGSEGVRSLALMKWNNLELLDLSENNIGDEGATFLSLGKWPSIISLNLEFNHIGAEGFKSITLSRFHKIQELNLKLNNLGDDGIEHIESNIWPDLRELNLERNGIGSDGVRSLIIAKINNLEILNLNFNQIGNEGMKFLSMNKWKKLTELSLKKNKITTEGIKGVDFNKWEYLKVLELEGNFIRDGSVKFNKE